MKGFVEKRLLKVASSIVFASLLFSGSTVALTDSSFTNMDGQNVSFKEHITPGKWVIVEVWQSGCRPCKATTRDLSQFDKEHQNIDVVGVSLDGAHQISKTEAFMQKHNVNFKNLMADPLAFQFFYLGESDKNFRGTPTVMIYTPEGELAAVKEGPTRPDNILAFIDQKSASTPSVSTRSAPVAEPEVPAYTDTVISEAESSQTNPEDSGSNYYYENVNDEDLFNF